MTEKPKRDGVPVPPNFTLFKRLVEQLRLAWFLFFDSRVSILLKVLPVFGLAYALSPIDLMPDFFPLIGWLDDFAIVVVTLALFVTLAPRAVRNELLEQMRRKAGYKVRIDKDGVIIDVKANQPGDDTQDNSSRARTTYNLEENGEETDTETDTDYREYSTTRDRRRSSRR